MRLDPLAPRSFAVISAAALFLVVLLLVGGVAVTVGTAPPASAALRPSATAPAPATTPSHSASPRPTASVAPVGSVVDSPLLNYNTTIRGNFGSSVWDWSIGPGTLVPSTGDLWLSDNLTSVFRGAPPASAPAIVYDPNRNSFVGTVPQLANTSDLLYDPVNGWIYSTDPLNNTVGVFDPTTGAWLHSFPVGSDPSALALDPANSILYVANSGSNNLTLINTSTGLISASSVATGSSPESLAFDFAHSQLFVACSGSALLYVINTTTDAVVTIPLLGNAGEVAVSEVAGTAAVTLPSHGRLTVLYTATLAVLSAIVPVGLNSRVVATSPSGGEFVVADSGGNLIVTINASSATVTNASIPVGAGPNSLTTDGTSGLVYSWSPVYRNLTPVNPDSGVVALASPTLGARPVATAYDPVTNRLFVADSLTHSLIVLSATTFASLAAPILLPSRPYSLADDPSVSTIYVGLAGSIVTVDAATAQLGSLNVSLPGPNGVLLVDGSTGLLWDLNNASGLVALNLNTLTLALSTPISPASSILGALALDPTTEQLYATTSGISGTEVAVLDAVTGAVVASGIVAGTNVTGLAYVPSDGQVYAMGDGLTMINATNFAVVNPPIPLPHHISLGSSMAFDPSRQFLYVTTASAPGVAGTVNVIDATTPASGYGSSGTIPLGFVPTALLTVALSNASSAASGMMVVGNLNSGSLGIIATSPARITFFESSPAAIDLGQSARLLLQYSGGVGATSVSYSGLPPGCSTQNTLILACTPSAVGTFAVVATVVDELGGTTTQAASLSVAPGLAVAGNFSAATFPELDPGYGFHATASTTGGTPGYTYSWSFGDGTSGSGGTVYHAYGNPGNYVLTLTAQDQLGGTGAVSWSVRVNPAPTVAAVVSSPVVDVNHSVSFTSTATGGTGMGPTAWTFGDGSSGSGTAAVHSWSRPGTYLVNVTYHDSLGGLATSALSVLVNGALTGDFTVVPPPGTIPIPARTLEFQATPAGGTSPYTVVWSFGDGSAATGDQVNHSYAAAGNYSVNVTVTDRTGATLNATLTVSVSPTPSSSAGSALTFPIGLFLGVLAGAALAAVVVYAAGPRRRKEHPPPPPPSPYVPPETAEWKED